MSKFRIAVFTAAMTGLLSVALSASAVAAGFDSATGDVGWTTAFTGSRATAQFVAQGTDPARGTVTVTNHDNVSFTGVVTCYKDLPGGLAEFGGTISSYSFVDPATGNANRQGLNYFVFEVQDNGSPGNLSATTNPDKLTLYRPFSTPDCMLNLGTNQPLTDGNLVVHQH